MSTPASTSRLPQATSRSPPSSPGSNGLNTGAKAGIAVAIIAVAGILGAAFLFWLLRRRARAKAGPQGGKGEDVGEMEENQGGNLDNGVEILDGTPIGELSSVPRQAELAPSAVDGIPGGEPPAVERQFELNSNAVNVLPDSPVELEASRTRGI